jgi:antitoxin component YwqK of YwqJK toxin-antitoxin module
MDKLIKTKCETYTKGKNRILKLKKKYKSLKEAQYRADKFNIRLNSKVKIQPYQCPVCDKFHIGRTSESLTDEYVDKIMIKLTPSKYQSKLSGLKVVGNIDISKFKEDFSRVSNRISYHKNGNVKTVSPITGRIKNGLSIKYTVDGDIQNLINFKDNKKRGIEIRYIFIENKRKVTKRVINVDNKIIIDLTNIKYLNYIMKPYVFKP